MRDVERAQLEVMLPQCVTERRTWILVRPDHDPVFDLLRKEWPGGLEQAVATGDITPPIVFWTPPAARPY